jgi:putative phage-type endonuclease
MIGLTIINCWTLSIFYLVLLLLVGPSKELASSAVRAKRAKRLVPKKQQIQELIKTAPQGQHQPYVITSSLPKSAPPPLRYVSKDRQKQEILREDIASVTILASNAASVLLVNGTTITVNPPELNQRTMEDVWLAVRSTLQVTASEFSAVLNTSYFTTREELIDIKMGNHPAFNGNAACTWGLRVEPTAFRQYVQATGHLVAETGLHIHSNGKYGASPDGLVVDKKDGSQGLLEIKCMYGKRTKTKMKQYNYCPNRFYDQIQGQMAVCDKPWCDLMIWIPKNSKQKNYSILRVFRNETYWDSKLSPALEVFCNQVATFKKETRI